MERDLTLAITAQLLEYPHPHLAAQARAAAAWLDVVAPDAAAEARRFAAAVERFSLGALEETYTAAFDFGTMGTLYAGEHLFGASEARATFLARLRVLQREHDVESGAELPDHVAELLRLAAAMPPGADRDALLEDAVLPTARAAHPLLADTGHPYAAAVATVISVVEHVAPRTRFDEPHGDARRRPDAALFEPSPEAAP